ncbi:hypothetical protein ACFO6R_14785 [Eubacterium multiforme]|uniref:Uncharacterized protein n=1 Tax=Eubacterium multiforme TaxID=83339 RepID=A0ABT9UWL7_9FIRM|nr:hypothetical protein [Eubacterium multiforme]MDQ0150703.1 hypothetical protein [Eubacterium multiforme]
MRNGKRLTRKQAVLAKKIYEVDDPKERFLVHRWSKESITFYDKLKDKVLL